MKKILLLLVLFGTSYLYFSPRWTVKIPESKYFHYFKGIGIGTTEIIARQSAVNDAVEQYVSFVEAQIETKSEFKDVFNEKNDDFSFSSEISREILITGKSDKVFGMRVIAEDKDAEKSQCKYYVLIRIPRKREYANMAISKPYGVSPIWRSIIIPGWGQIYKKEKTKGYLILSSEALLVASTIIFRVIGSNYNQKAVNYSYDEDQRKIYEKNADRAYLIANTSMIIGGVIYLYNIIDVISSEGEPKFAQNEFDFPFALALNKNNIIISYYVKF